MANPNSSCGTSISGSARKVLLNQPSPTQNLLCRILPIRPSPTPPEGHQLPQARRRRRRLRAASPADVARSRRLMDLHSAGLPSQDSSHLARSRRRCAKLPLGRGGLSPPPCLPRWGRSFFVSKSSRGRMVERHCVVGCTSQGRWAKTCGLSGSRKRSGFSDAVGGVGVPRLNRTPLNSLRKPPFQGGWGCLAAPVFECTRLPPPPSEKPPSNEGLGEVPSAGAHD